MNEKMKEELKSALNEVLNERDRLDHETHKNHHDWITHQMDNDAKRKERMDTFRKTFRKSLIGALTVAAVGGAIKLLAAIGGVVLGLIQTGAAK